MEAARNTTCPALWSRRDLPALGFGAFPTRCTRRNTPWAAGCWPEIDGEIAERRLVHPGSLKAVRQWCCGPGGEVQPGMVERNAEAPQEKQIDTKQFPYGIRRPVRVPTLLITSVQTLKLSSVLGPNVLLIATSAASRPRAMSTRPIRGTLFRGSKMYQRPPRYASIQAAKSIGPYGGRTPISPR